MGLRVSGAHVKVYRHNGTFSLSPSSPFPHSLSHSFLDTVDLECVLRRAIETGQPGSGKPYTMIMIVVEGIYSMEGIICKLPEIVRIKRKYKVPFSSLPFSLILFLTVKI
jgi:serine palmitoyltransferase